MRFTLKNLVTEGATVYPPGALEELYVSRLGQTVTLQEIFEIAAAIETKYRDDGYILTRAVVPAQRIEDGTVTIRVVEGYVSEVRISGDVGAVQELLQSYLDKITKSRPARVDEIERYLLLANDVAGITAQGVLRPATGQEGAAQLVVTVERDPFDGFVRIDNRESRFTGRWRTVGAAAANSFTRFGERVQATGVLALDFPEQWFAGLHAEGRIGSEGFVLRGSVSYEEEHPGFTLEPLDVDTDTVRFSLSGAYPLIRSRRTNLYLNGGFDLANVDVDILDLAFTRDRLRVVWFGAEFDHRDTWGGANVLAASLRQGLGILDATDDDGLRSRADADGAFTSLQLSAARLQRITETLNFYAGGKAQFSFDPLLADEECSVGGENYGRGYDPAEVTEDDCLAATVELQFNPEWRPEFLADFLDSYQLYAFYDVGKVWPENGDFDDGASLSSAGIGLRSYFAETLRLDLEVAKPLTRDRGADTDDRRAPQFYLGVTAQF
ncbi:MAG: BamA/TamA family outer membrane protein [Rhodospirillales bacterium]|nr:BamA/TamA family outer membrane protein [Rhodospirillales bacterium]